jgi:hypothetical protein
MHKSNRTVHLDVALGRVQRTVVSNSARFERGVCFAYHAKTSSYVVRFSGVTSKSAFPGVNDPPLLGLPVTFSIPGSTTSPPALTAFNKYWVDSMSVQSTIDNSVNIPNIPSIASYSHGTVASDKPDADGYYFLSDPHAVLCAVDTRLRYIILGRISGTTDLKAKKTTQLLKSSTPQQTSWSSTSSSIHGTAHVVIPALDVAVTVPLPPGVFSTAPSVLVSNSSGKSAPYPVVVHSLNSITPQGFDIVALGAPAGTQIDLTWVASS